MTDSTAISWNGVTVALGGNDVVHGLTLDVPTGTWMSLIGPNGAGKTTLVRTLSGAVAHRGTIRLGRRDVHDLSIRDRARSVAVVPQHPVIPPGMRVFDYVVLGRAAHQGLRCSPSILDRRRTVAVLQRLDLESFRDRRVDTLSGGERQRVVLARAIVQDTPLLVLDEPTAALDVGHQLDVLELVADLRTERELTVVTTVHDLSVAGQFADVVAVMADGRLVASGAPADVLTPETIGAHWGVDASTAVADDGTVTVTVRRRREPRLTPEARSRTEQRSS
ncbi:ABC transporter ATP-binding protein [Actinospongicola halichondriae]|uniref:ABC transporter ATP-binding protein n=1 Tax=Actinospongicola halichondriae TaxID=3236844 RepID=UPI003D4D16B4